VTTHGGVIASANASRHEAEYQEVADIPALYYMFLDLLISQSYLAGTHTG
jgi:hypothetical protein